MFDVVAIGELLIDFTCVEQDSEGYPTMSAHPGGAPANFLAALSSFGAKTAMIGKVGDDTFGKLLLNTLVSHGIDISGMVKDDSVFTTLAFVTLDEHGDRTFAFSRKPGADTCLNVGEINFDIIDHSNVFHFGTLSLTAEPSRTATYHAVEYARKNNKIITFDPNLRKPLWSNLDDAKKEILWGVDKADIVKISDEEVEFTFDLSPEEGAKHIFENYSVKLVFVTCGADGCYFRNAVSSGYVPASAGIKAIDTTGAGDIFGGSAVWKILESNVEPENLTEEELRNIVEFASASAGLSTMVSGGISSVPSIDEVLSFLNK